MTRADLIHALARLSDTDRAAARVAAEDEAREFAPVVHACSVAFGVSRADLYNGRTRAASTARLAAYALCSDLGLTQQRIADHFGRDHSTVCQMLQRDLSRWSSQVEHARRLAA